VLIFFGVIGIIAHISNTRAAPSSYLAPFDVSPTATPTPTPTPTPPPTATPTPTPSPTPAPVPTTPAAQPTSPAGGPAPTQEPGTMPTATPTGTVTATPTKTAIPATGIVNPPIHTTTHPQPANPNSGGNVGDAGVLGMSLGIGTSGIALLGGGLFWFHLRRKPQGVTALQKRPMNANAMAFSANNAMLSRPNTFQRPSASTPQRQAGPFYTPDTHNALTMASPLQAPNQQAPAFTPYVPTSDMNPLAFDAFDLAQESIPGTPLGQRISQPASAFTPINLPPMRDLNPPSFDAFDLAQESTSAAPLAQRISQPVPAVAPINLPPMRDLDPPSFDALDLAQESTPNTPLAQRISQPVPAINPSNLPPMIDLDSSAFDVFDLSAAAAPLAPSINLPVPAIPPTNLPPIGQADSSTVTPLPNLPLIPTTEGRLVQPPDVAEDQTLLEVMRQAQMGLFVLSD